MIEFVGLLLMSACQQRQQIDFLVDYSACIYQIVILPFIRRSQALYHLILFHPPQSGPLISFHQNLFLEIFLFVSTLKLARNRYKKPSIIISVYFRNPKFGSLPDFLFLRWARGSDSCVMRVCYRSKGKSKFAAQPIKGGEKVYEGLDKVY